MESVDWFSIVTGLSMGLALAATCGLRAFLPLFGVSVLAYMGKIELAESFSWMAAPVAVRVRCRHGAARPARVDDSSDRLKWARHRQP